LSDQTVLVHLQAISSTAPCPQCGTPSSRVHCRYRRTIADVALGGRHLLLKLHVRKWICREASCPQCIFAERFPGLVRRYARMTDRLVEALQSVGVTTNGADAARILSSLGMPTTAKTVIRHVLQLPLPGEGSVHEVGLDEWAWKKGHHYGTILVDLAERRVVQLLADRSVETSKAWLRTHPEIRIVSRGRGKLFREAATDGAPQAQQVVDRFHLQKNFAEALEKFFRHKTRVLKAGARSLAGKARPVARTAAAKIGEKERRGRHRQRVAVHKRIWKLYREGYHNEQIAQLVGVSSRSVYRALEQEVAPPPRRRSRSHSIIDPSLSYRSRAMESGMPPRSSVVRGDRCGIGYPGSRRTMEIQLLAFRPHGAYPVSKQTTTLEKPPSARSTALMIVRPVQNRTPEQTAFLEQLTQSDLTVAKAYTLAQDFSRLLAIRGKDCCA
jgi:transposase